MLFQFRVYARDLAKNVLLTAGPAPVQWQQNLNFKFEPLEQESYSRKAHPETRCRQLHSHVQINTHTHTVVAVGRHCFRECRISGFLVDFVVQLIHTPGRCSIVTKARNPSEI